MSPGLFIYPWSVPFKSFFLTLVLWLQLLALGLNIYHVEAGEPAGTAEQQLAVAQAPEYRAGETWIFRSVEKLAPGASRSDALTGTYRISVGPKGGLGFSQLYDDKFIPLTALRDLWLLLPAKRIIAHETQYYKFPISIGEKWPASYRSGSRSVSAETVVNGFETVTVPAGVFQAYRIERMSHFVGGNNTRVDITFTYFYSPQTKSIVRYHVMTDTKWGVETNLWNQIDIELLEVKSRRAQ
jgi:hypothetical protein